MERGSLAAKYTDRTNPMDKHMEHMMSVREYEVAPPAPQMFGNAGREHMEKYGKSLPSCCEFASKEGNVWRSRHEARTLCEDCVQKSQALHEEPVLAGGRLRLVASSNP
jgi:hypothetical protein